jgi:hypothetical protein
MKGRLTILAMLVVLVGLALVVHDYITHIESPSLAESRRFTPSGTWLLRASTAHGQQARPYLQIRHHDEFATAPFLSQCT